MNDIKSSVYAQKVELLLRLIPIVMEEEVFAIHGGTAINLFLKDLPRYSVDIDLTYIPLADRQTSLDDINLHLKTIADKAKKAFKGMHIVPNFSTCKLLCEYRGRQVKIEVNQTKRGIIGGDVQTIPLSEKAQEEYMASSLSQMPLPSLLQIFISCGFAIYSIRFLPLFLVLKMLNRLDIYIYIAIRIRRTNSF